LASPLSPLKPLKSTQTKQAGLKKHHAFELSLLESMLNRISLFDVNYLVKEKPWESDSIHITETLNMEHKTGVLNKLSSQNIVMQIKESIRPFKQKHKTLNQYTKQTLLKYLIFFNHQKNIICITLIRK